MKLTTIGITQMTDETTTLGGNKVHLYSPLKIQATPQKLCYILCSPLHCLS